MKGRVAAIVMAVLLVLYLVLVVRYGVILLASGSGVGAAIALALFVLSAIAAWALLRELWFGVQTQRLVRLLETEGGLPVDDLPHRASGRPLRDAADEEFPQYKAEVERAPESWRAWFRLGLAYDASGDRRRARHAMREAIKLHRTAPASSR